MKEIGKFLKSTRIKNGVSLEEAAEDLNISANQLENIEDGNIRAFKDVFALRKLVKDYGKYLGIKTEEIIDEFNDFMFEHTSKISLDDILEARKISKEKDDEEKVKVVSPYTNIRKPKFKIDKIKLKQIIMIITIVLLVFVSIFIWFKISSKEDKVTSELKGSSLEDVYEFTY